MRRYLKTDRNGTKYYSVATPCIRCGGTGVYGDLGTCYRCGGYNPMTHEKGVEKVYTPEYRAKLDARNAKRNAEKAAREAEAEAERRAGWAEHDYIYILLGDTYGQRAEIKAEGGRYDRMTSRWYMTAEPAQRPYLKLDRFVYGKRNGYNGAFYEWDAKKAQDLFKVIAKAEEELR